MAATKRPPPFYSEAVLIVSRGHRMADFWGDGGCRCGSDSGGDGAGGPGPRLAAALLPLVHQIRIREAGETVSSHTQPTSQEEEEAIVKVEGWRAGLSLDC